MRRRPRRSNGAGIIGALLLLPSVAAGQGASPYLPLDHRAMPFVEHLIRTGAIADPLPLSRPLTRRDVADALRRADDRRMDAAARGLVATLERALADRDTVPHYRVEAYLGAAAGTYARREPVRQEGNDFVSPEAGALVEGVWGAVVLSSHGFVSQRLNEDPDYGGTQNRWIGGRLTDAYVGLQGRYAELTFGNVSRHWGPNGLPGLLVSAEPYSYDHLYLRVGTPALRLEALATELDAMDIGGERVRRFYAASRVVVQPTRAFGVALSQASLPSGVGRGFEPWWINPLKSTTQNQQDESDTVSVNSAYQLTVRTALPAGVVLHGEFLLDDLAAILSESTAPDRIAATLMADVPVHASAAVRLSYTLVSSLTYRSSEGPDQTLMRRGVGLGRNYADYTQWSLDASVLLRPDVVLLPEIVLVRQGEGDLRDPFPQLPATDHPFLFEGVVERTLRLGLGAAVMLPAGIWFEGDAGWHAYGNAGHIQGATRSEFVARIGMSIHGSLSGELPR